MIRKILALPLLLLLCGTLSAQTAVDVEIGYRWLDLTGNEPVYRTQINERDGVLLRSLTILGGESSAFDHFRLDASDLGTGPAGAFRLDAGKANLWNGTLTFRQADAFDYHLGYALGQHLIDRQRTNFDLDLEFLPGRTITPFIGYSYGKYDGPGRTTYALGQDEFVLNSDMDESENEIRGGIGFNTSRFVGAITQGWRNLDSNERMTLAPLSEGGNNPGSILGHPITASGITRDSNFEVKTPFTNAWVTADLLPRLRLVGDFSRFAADGDGPESESSTGSFVSFPLQRFYNGLTENVSSRAKNTTWRGGVRGEYTLADNVDAFAGWRTERRDLDGSATFNSIFRDTVNFSGADPIAALEEVFDARSAMQRKENIFEAGVAARQLGPFSIRAALRRTDEDVTLNPDVEEIVVVGPEQGGSYERSINTLDATAGFSRAHFTASLNVRADRSDDSILRTDFRDRDRIRLRGAYAFTKAVRIGAMIEKIDHENDNAGVNFDSETRQYGADAEVSITEKFRLRGAFTHFQTDASSLIRHPESFQTETWTYEENGDSIEGGFAFFFAPFSLDADYITYENEGSNPFDIDRYRARVAWDFIPRVGLAAEWARDNYDESVFPSSGFEATRYGVFLRWHQ